MNFTSSCTCHLILNIVDSTVGLRFLHSTTRCVCLLCIVYIRREIPCRAHKKKKSIRYVIISLFTYCPSLRLVFRKEPSARVPLISSMKALFNSYTVLPKVHYAAYEMNNFSSFILHTERPWLPSLPSLCISYAKGSDFLTFFRWEVESCAQVPSIIRHSNDGIQTGRDTT